MSSDPLDSADAPRPVAGNGLRQVPLALLPELADAAWQAGFLISHVALAGVHDKAGLLAAFAHGLAFPDGLGGNWDGLADALDDLSWLQGPAHAILVDGAAGLRARAPQVLATLEEIIAEVASGRAAAGLPFQVFLCEEAMPAQDGEAGVAGTSLS